MLTKHRFLAVIRHLNQLRRSGIFGNTAYQYCEAYNKIFLIAFTLL
ncbi:MAG: hypothetical protein AAF960_23700 [Bacteroidota bacterium]